MSIRRLTLKVFFSLIGAFVMMAVGVLVGVWVSKTPPSLSFSRTRESTDEMGSRVPRNDNQKTTELIEEDHGVPSSTLLEVLGETDVIEPVAVSTTGTQYVLLSFDGSRSLQMWRDTMAFAREMRAEGKPLSFTYYVSGVYFFPESKKDGYKPPHHATGTSFIGYGTDETDVQDRVALVQEALKEGHEIGSHANGHFNGSTWMEADWKSEMNQFEQFLAGAHVPAWYGFRAPELGRNPAMYKVLAEKGFIYDASGVRKPTDHPTKDKNGITELALAKIQYAHTTSSVLSMDYNFFVKQSGAKDVAKKGTSEWQKMYDDMLTSYRTYFDTNYNGTHAPVIIGHHFSLWNDGVYFEVMKEFAREVCGLPNVKCVTMREYAETVK